MNTEHRGVNQYVIGIVIACLMAGLGYTSYQNYLLKKENAALASELTKTQEDFASTTTKLSGDIETFKTALLETQSGRINAEQNVRMQNEMLDTLSRTLSVYEKVVSTDRELLAKYSRVYFLSENYSPRALTIIPSSYIFDPKKERTIAHSVLPFLQEMFDAAQTENVDLKILSAYRSFEEQSTLKSSYTVSYGSGANRFSADQGYSEHQLGTTIDVTTSKLGAKNETFEKTSAYTWLTENAYKYGFILSYPKNNTYYIFEPWHWRFVGKKLAQKLHDENKKFADMPQRELDEYLMSLFDR